MNQSSADQARHKAEAIQVFRKKPFSAPEQAAWLGSPSEVNGGLNLHEAAKSGKIELFQPIVLMQAAAYLAVQDTKLQTPVHYAAQYGHLSPLSDLLTPDLLAMTNAEGLNPIQVAACYGGLPQLLRFGLLTRENVFVNYPAEQSPMHLAVKHGQNEQIKALLMARILTRQDLEDFTAYVRQGRNPQPDPSI